MKSLPSSRTDEVLFQENLRRRNVIALQLEAALGAILVPIFWVLDWWVIREYVTTTLVLRLATPCYAILILLGEAKWPAFIHRWVNALAISYSLLISWTIAIICWFHTGYESPYYAGINLVIVGAGLLFSWPLSLSVLFFALLYGFYMMPLLIGLIPIHDTSLALSNQFFLVSTIIIIFFSQRHRFQLEKREVFGNLALQRTKASLEEAFSKLQIADNLKTQFFNNITHELRTPITMILSPVEMVLAGDMGPLEPNQINCFKTIWRNALKLLKLINSLLDLAKIEENFLRLRIEKTDLVELLREIVEHSRPLALRKAITLDLNILQTRDDLYVDLEKMECVLVNIVANALKFTLEKGRVMVFLDVIADEMQITVSDTGIGIPADKLKSIFERFQQGDATVTRRFGGTGIGLAYAREIVHLHGGRITVESTLGQGSTFVIHLLPGTAHFNDNILDRRVRDKATANLQRKEDGSPREWARQLQESKEYRFLDIEEVTQIQVVECETASPKATKILVVEDTVEILRFIASQLQHEHSVCIAENGRQGLEVAKKEHPDIIITDYMMPEMDGLSLLKALRATSELSDIPIIMLTAKNQLFDRLEAREAGADLYLSKPFSPRELRLAIQQLLQKRGRMVSNMIQAQKKSLEIVTAGLAHEIHNPLSYIKNAFFMISEKTEGITKMLAQSDPTADEQTKQLQKMQSQIDNMISIANRGINRIEQIVQLVRRYAREGFPSEPTELLLECAIRDVVQLLMPLSENQTEIFLDLQAPNAIVRCIPEEMHQVIRNLGQNAIESLEQHGGKVWLRTRCESTSLIFEVEDNGKGIPREYLPRLFTPFFSTKEPGRGMGLGLAITYQVVTQSGGSIEVQSTVGQGTVFRVTFPLIERVLLSDKQVAQY